MLEAVAGRATCARSSTSTPSCRFVAEAHAPGITAFREALAATLFGLASRLVAPRGDPREARRGRTRLPRAAAQDDARSPLHVGFRRARLRRTGARRPKGAAGGHRGVALDTGRAHGPDADADAGRGPAGEQHGRAGTSTSRSPGTARCWSGRKRRRFAEAISGPFTASISARDRRATRNKIAGHEPAARSSSAVRACGGSRRATGSSCTISPGADSATTAAGAT